MPLLIAAMSFREVERAETAHKSTDRSKAHRQEERREELEAQPRCRETPINQDHNSG